MALILALGCEAAFGYPDPVYRRIGHPVTWIGHLIAATDRALNVPLLSFPERRVAGIAALLAIVLVPAALAVVIERALPANAFGTLTLAAIAATLIAARSLHDHVRDVGVALETGGIEAGRMAVSKIVGRDPEALNAHGVARAAIESLAENASDGVVAPVFWFAILGLPGLVAYKAINTADSMIGHRSETYAAFGWAAARLDDLVNLPASRLTGLLFALAARFVPGASLTAALAAMRRDAWRHRSPNAGWPESAMAGALGLKLAGPRQYSGATVDDAFMGDGRCEATATDIRLALRLAGVAWMAMVAGLVVIAVAMAIWRA